MKMILLLSVLVFFILSSSVYAFTQNSDLSNNIGIIVYPNQGWYTAKDFHDNVLINNNIANVVIQKALDRSGDIYIAGGTYGLSQDFSGFYMKTGTHLKLAPDAKIVVPSGYDGYVFGFNDRTANCVVDGGIIDEAKPVKRNWIAIMMNAGTIYFNSVENMIVNNPYVVIKLNGNEGYFINANTFVNIQSTYFVRGIEFDFNGVLSNGNGIYGNTFRDLQFQSGPMTTYGVKDVKHGNNAFYNVQFWDMPLGSRSTIDSSATNTLIIGGQMTNYGFLDNGVGTVILDSWHPNNVANSTLLSTISRTINPQTNASVLLTNTSTKVSKQYDLEFINGSTVNLSVLQNDTFTVNISGFINNPTGDKVSVKITKPNGSIEQNDAYMKLDGNFLYPIMMNKNSLRGSYKIDGIYQNYHFGSMLINITDNQIVMPINSSINNTTIVSNKTTFVDIKNKANMWSKNEISDELFGSDIQYLINIGVLDHNNQSQFLYVPHWLKTDAGLWSEGKISSSDFLSIVNYLIDNDVIQLP